MSLNPNLQVEGSIFLYDFEGAFAGQQHKAAALKIEGKTLDRHYFSPNGISAYEGQFSNNMNSRRTIFWNIYRFSQKLKLTYFMNYTTRSRCVVVDAFVEVKEHSTNDYIFFESH